jgi:protocatechuate 3,4-dioxygenase beta subunit
MKYCNFSRRQFLRGSSLAGAAFAFTAAGQSTLKATPAHTEGPFYPVVGQDDKDSDLTMYHDSEVSASGQIITVNGLVLDDLNVPIANAVVDVWQANAAGRYAHERDSNPAPLDPNFQGWAIIKTDDEGRFQFKTVKPGAYPVSENWTRPPHIHFKVSRRGYRKITTQMYFDGEPLNDVDKLLNELPGDLQPTLIATRKSKADPFQFNIVLARDE